MNMPLLLQYPGMAEQLTDRLQENFTLHLLDRHTGIGGLPVNVREVARGIVLSGGNRLDADEIALLPALEIVSCYSVGYDGVDAAAAARRGVLVTNTPGVLNDEVANTAIALLLVVTRRLVALDRYVRSGRWIADGDPPLTRGLASMHVGILGLGRIGQAIARKLSVFGCRIGYHARNEKPELPYRYFAGLTDMAEEVDVLIVATPGGASTHNLVDTRVLDALGTQGTLINIARGSVVDEDALLSALHDGRLGAAGLDVFANEPNVPAELLQLENVVLLPHIGSATVETRRAMGDLAVENLIEWFRNGRVVTPVPECESIAPA